MLSNFGIISCARTASQTQEFNPTFLRARLEVYGFFGFELKFYVTVDRIIRSSYQTDLAWNYRAKCLPVQSFCLISFLKNHSIDFSFKLKTAFKKWNEMILVVSLMWCAFLIWLRKCQELKINHIMLTQNLKWICCFL